MSNRGQAQSGGIGLTSAVFLVFLVLKLIGQIDWSWWWVTAPLWMPILAFFAVIGAAFLVAWPAAVIASIVDTRRRNKRMDDMYRAIKGRQGGAK